MSHRSRRPLRPCSGCSLHKWGTAHTRTHRSPRPPRLGSGFHPSTSRVVGVGAGESMEEVGEREAAKVVEVAA